MPTTTTFLRTVRMLRRNCKDFAVITHGTFGQPKEDLCLNPTPYTIGRSVWGKNLSKYKEYAGTCGGNGSESVYRFIAEQDGTVCLHTAGSTADTVLYVREALCDNNGSSACNDDIQNGLRYSQIELAVTKGQEYFVFVDYYSPFTSGSFILNSSYGACGDGLPNVPANHCP